jgi:hypothetical protein
MVLGDFDEEHGIPQKYRGNKLEFHGIMAEDVLATLKNHKSGGFSRY